jgi:hypothetical protein
VARLPCLPRAGLRCGCRCFHGAIPGSPWSPWSPRLPWSRLRRSAVSCSIAAATLAMERAQSPLQRIRCARQAQMPVVRQQDRGQPVDACRVRRKWRGGLGHLRQRHVEDGKHAHPSHPRRARRQSLPFISCRWRRRHSPRSPRVTRGRSPLSGREQPSAVTIW